MSDRLFDLLVLFARLSLLAFGGGNTVLPEMRHAVVDVHHWMTTAEFTGLFALAQAAPGPNMMISTLVGLRVAGIPGALVATLGIIGPSSVLVIATVSTWQHFRDAPWRRIVQAGLAPVTVGLVAASAGLIVTAADTSWFLAAVTLAAAGVSMFSRLHPLWLLGGGALLGVLAGA